VSFEAGEMAGDYQVLERIGQGGMGTVYRVRHTIYDRVEAMKVLLPDLQEAEGLEERFLREIRVQASLSHPNIASLHTAFRFRNQLLMVMEFIDGESLRTAMTTRGLTVTESVRCIKDVLKALSYAHSRGVVHRDIKPGNIMITTQGQVKLLDFGLASAARGDHITRSGAVMGSMHYMSPEQVRSEPADARSDIYSVGVTLYQMVTGTTPIPGENDYELMRGHLHHVPVYPSIVNPQVPANLAGAIMKALEKDPARRFQTAVAFAASLEGQETITLPATETPKAASSGLDPARIEKATKILAQYIGPIARVVVKREMKSTGEWLLLRERLAAEIPSDVDRQKFLSETK
jgi:serine/threonine-protein kinase